MKIFAWQCDPYNSLTRVIQRAHFGYHCQRTKVILAASFFFPRNLKSLIFFFLDTEGEILPTFIAIKFISKINLGQYLRKNVLLQMLSMRSYAMCHIPDTSISYAQSSGSFPSGWWPGETLGRNLITGGKQYKRC